MAKKKRNPNFDIDTEELRPIRLKEIRRSPVWPDQLEQLYGAYAACQFVVGSDMLLKEVNQALFQLSRLPKGTHIGQLEQRNLTECLPEQFLMEYNYEFIYAVLCNLLSIRHDASQGFILQAYSILDELIFCWIVRMVESRDAIAHLDFSRQNDSLYEERDWLDDLMHHPDLIQQLYGHHILEKTHPYYFTNWQRMDPASIKKEKFPSAVKKEEDLYNAYSDLYLGLEDDLPF